MTEITKESLMGNSWGNPSQLEFDVLETLSGLDGLVKYATKNKQYHILEGVQTLVSEMLREASEHLNANPVINDPRTAETVH